MENQIQHFSHEHPLVLETDDSCERCLVCWQAIPSPMYFCVTRFCNLKYGIHKSCAELPREMIHPFHPQHSLTLLAKSPYVSGCFGCDACGKSSWAFTFHCYECQFDLDVCCASLIPIKSKGGQGHHHQIQNLSHPHPLIPCENKMNIFEVYYCSGCKLPFKERWMIYVCLDCKCLLDESCAEWPSQIEHPFHPQHPLTLLARPPSDPDSDSSRCRACGKELEGFTFHCAECKFSMDASCASLMPTRNCEGNSEGSVFQTQQLRHPHPLILCEIINKKKGVLRLACDACHLQFEDSVYICIECSFLLHQSCADLPREVKQTFYHQHTLTLLEYSPRHLEEPFVKKQLHLEKCHPSNPGHEICASQLSSFHSMGRSLFLARSAHKFKGGHFQCHACHVYTLGFAYECPECKLYFDIRCPFSKPRLIKSQLHQHPLAFFNLKSIELYCNACQWNLCTPFFRCVGCNFNLHLKCVPSLPPTVKHQCHIHSLTLTKSAVKDHPDEDEHAEFYCDACEERRELFDCTYYCEGCHYVAHVHCVVFEVLRILLEEWFLARKLEETKLDISSKVHEGNTDKSESKSLRIEKVLEQGGLVLQSDAAGADEPETASSSSEMVENVISGVPTNSIEITARGGGVLANITDIELDEKEISEESLATELEATKRRSKELEETFAQHVPSIFPAYGESHKKGTMSPWHLSRRIKPGLAFYSMYQDGVLRQARPDQYYGANKDSQQSD